MASDLVLNDDNTVTVVGTALQVDAGASFRGGDDGTPRNAVAHAPGDVLSINDGGFYTGGVNINGPATVTNGLTVWGDITLAIRVHKPKIGGSGGGGGAEKSAGASGGLSGVFGGADPGSSGFTGAPGLSKPLFDQFRDFNPEQIDLVQEIVRLRRAIVALEAAVNWLLGAYR